MTSVMKGILHHSEKYRTIWHRTYAPLRRVLAGDWESVHEGSGFRMKFDQFGGYNLVCRETQTDQGGRYMIVSQGGKHYIVLNSSEGETPALEIVEVGPWRLRLRWVGSKGPAFEMTRRTGALQLFNETANASRADASWLQPLAAAQ